MRNLEQAQGVAIGIAFGLMVGLATDNIALWLCIGVAIGASYVKKERENRGGE